MTAPRGGSTAAPDKFCAFVSIDSGSGELTQSLEFSDLRSLAFGFCQFLAVLGILSKLCGIRAQKDLAMLNYCAKDVPSGVAGSCREWHAAFVVCKFSWRFFAFSQNLAVQLRCHFGSATTCGRGQWFTVLRNVAPCYSLDAVPG